MKKVKLIVAIGIVIAGLVMAYMRYAEEQKRIAEYSKYDEVVNYNSLVTYTVAGDSLVKVGCDRDTQVIMKYTKDTLVFTHVLREESIGFKPMLFADSITLIALDINGKSIRFTRMRNAKTGERIVYFQGGKMVSILSTSKECFEIK